MTGAVLDDQLYERCFRIKAKVVYLNYFTGLRSAPTLLYLIPVRRSDALWIGNCEKITFASVNIILVTLLWVPCLIDTANEGERQALHMPIGQSQMFEYVLHENAELTQCYGVTRYDPCSQTPRPTESVPISK